MWGVALERLEEIYVEAKKFVEKHFPNMGGKEKYKAILKVMNMLLQLEPSRPTVAPSAVAVERIAKVKGETLRLKDALGEDYEKLDVKFNDKGEILEIKPKGWLGKEKWSEINSKIEKLGYKWLSRGKESKWIKTNSARLVKEGNQDG